MDRNTNNISIEWVIGIHAFEIIHGFHFADHKWSMPIPCVDYIETYEEIVLKDHPKLLNKHVSTLAAG